MSINDKLLDFVTRANYSDDSISYIKSELGRTNKQLIRDSFMLLKSSIQLYDKSERDSLVIYNTINLIITLCSKEIFSSEEIEINKNRIKQRRKLLYPYADDNELNLKSIDLLDEIILDKSVDTSQLIKLLKKLIDKLEDIEIVKKFINLNRAVVTESTELFDYVYDKIIEALKNDDRDVYYYITLLKITYSTRVNKDDYLNRLYQFEKDIITEEIEYIICGEKRPYDGKKILDKYGIITPPIILPTQTQSDLSSDESIITIDPRHTHIKDDALSVKKDGNKYIIKIYITNPTNIIKLGSKIDIDARNNFKSMYLPKNRIHMLNPKIETSVSLEKYKPREVFVLEVIVNNSGEILDYYLKKDTIVVGNNITYTDADNILTYARKDNDLYFINTLNYLANALRCNNNKKIEYWKLKDAANKSPERSESECLVSEYMNLYNRLIAKIAKDNNIPYVFRGKDEEYMTELMHGMGIDIDQRVQKLLSGLFLVSKYSSEPIFHHGLGFDCYSHSSNPGRQYVALYNQYLMNDYYFNRHNVDDFDYDNLKLLIEYFNKRDRELALMQAEYVRSLHLNK